MSDLRPLEPTTLVGLFPPLGRELIALLRGLDNEQWNLPTVCSAWAVRDIAAHLLDTGCRRLGVERDDHVPPPPGAPIEGYDDLVAYLDELNADWIHAARRLSPRIITDLLERIEPDLAETLEALDPLGEARFPVSWAGEDGSRVWFDVARELTERWLHQQQIRLAVGAQPLTDPELNEAIFDTLLRALPHRFDQTAIEHAPGARLQIEIVGASDYLYGLTRQPEGWQLLKGRLDSAEAAILVAEEVAWLSLTKGLDPKEARERSQVVGDETVAEPFFHTVAVMA